MPATNAELLAWERSGLTAEEMTAHVWEDGTTVSVQDMENLLALHGYRVRRVAALKMRRSPAQRKAMRLLRSLLTPEQRRQLRNGREFRVVGRSGHVYRLRPSQGHVDRVKRHGKNWYRSLEFCLHDDLRPRPSPLRTSPLPQRPQGRD